MNSPKLILNLANGQTASFELQGGFFSVHDPNAVLEAPTTYYGNAGGFPANGNRIDFTVNWQSLDGNHITSHFTGSIANDGTAKGSAVDNKNYRTDWASQGAFSCIDAPQPNNPPAPVNAPPPEVKPPVKCPEGSPVPQVPAGQTCPEIPAPTNKVSVTFNIGIPTTTVNVKNDAPIGGDCTYTATSNNGTPGASKDFKIAANSPASFTVLSPLLFTTYHTVTSCTGTFNGKKVEFGHDEQDVTFGSQ